MRLERKKSGRIAELFVVYLFVRWLVRASLSFVRPTLTNVSLLPASPSAAELATAPAAQRD